MALGILILLTFSEQPLLLLVISSALSAIVMFIYSILLIVLNRRALPAMIRISGYRLAILAFAVVWFGYFSARVVIEYGGQLSDAAGAADQAPVGDRPLGRAGADRPPHHCDHIAS